MGGPAVPMSVAPQEPQTAPVAPQTNPLDYLKFGINVIKAPPQAPSSVPMSVAPKTIAETVSPAGQAAIWNPSGATAPVTEKKTELPSFPWSATSGLLTDPAKQRQIADWFTQMREIPVQEQEARRRKLIETDPKRYAYLFGEEALKKAQAELAQPKAPAGIGTPPSLGAATPTSLIMGTFGLKAGAPGQAQGQAPGVAPVQPGTQPEPATEDGTVYGPQTPGGASASASASAAGTAPSGLPVDEWGIPTISQTDYVLKGLERYGLSPSVSEEIAKMDDKLKKLYNIDELNSRLLAMGTSDQVLKDMNQFVKDKDQYVKAVDASLDRMKTARGLSTTVLDPEAQKAYEAGLSYLTVLKGRQETRYQDYVKAAHDSWTANYNAVLGHYQQNAKLYEDALTQGTAITKERYDMIRQSLEQDYQNLYSLPEKVMTLEASKASMLNSTANTVVSTVGNTGAVDTKGYMDWKKDYGTPMRDMVLSSGDKWLKDVDPNGYLGGTENPELAILFYSDLYGDALINIKSDTSGTMTDQERADSAFRILDTATRQAKAFRAWIPNITDPYKAQQAEIQIQNLEKRIAESRNSAVRSELSGRGDTLRAAAKALMKYKDPAKMTDDRKAEWKASASGIPFGVLDAMWDQWKLWGSQPGNASMFSPVTGNIDKAPADEIIAAVVPAYTSYVIRSNQ